MYELKPIKYKREYELTIAREISKWFYNNIFKGCLDIVESKTVENANNILLEAIKSGLIYYQDGAFYSSRVRFSNAIAKELEAIGAKYSKYRKAYIISMKKLDVSTIWAIETTKAKTANVVSAIKLYLINQLENIDKFEKEKLIESAVETILSDLEKRVNKTIQDKKIITIAPKINDFRSNYLAKEYTENLYYYIKKWSSENIIKMREVVGQMAIEGKSQKDIAEYIENEYAISKRKALFLARNETAIATSKYLSAKYQDEGFTHFKWKTNLDGRERLLHKQLNGRIFAFDNPPVIYQRIKNGVVISEQRGLPAETYNCRCTMTPVYNREFLENRKMK